MKIKLIVFYLFLISLMPINALSFGVKNESQIVKPEESDFYSDYFSSSKTELFFSEDLNFRNFYFSLSPEILLEDNISFLFRKMKMSLVFDNIALSVGKYNLYFGNGIFYNPLFCIIPISYANEKNLWNGRYSITLDNLEIAAGTFIDTESIDKFKVPEYQNFFLLSAFSTQDFSIAIESDFLNYYGAKETSNSINSLKVGAEATLTKFSNISFYSSVCALWNITELKFKEFDFILGGSVHFDFHNFGITQIIDVGMKSNDFFICGRFETEFFDTCVFAIQATYYSSAVSIYSSLSLNFQNCVLSGSYYFPDLRNFEKRNDIIKISVQLGGG